MFGGVSDEPVTYVNAPQRAKDAGVDVREVSSTSSADWVNLITISGGGHSLSGTLAGRRSEHRIVLVDGHTFDVPPADHMLMVTNDDRPGVIGTVGTLLGDAGVNIADMDVGRAEEAGTAVMLIAPTSPLDPAHARGPPRRPRHHQRRRPAGVADPSARCGDARAADTRSRKHSDRGQVAARMASRVRRATARAASAKSSPDEA